MEFLILWGIRPPLSVSIAHDYLDVCWDHFMQHRLVLRLLLSQGESWTPDPPGSKGWDYRQAPPCPARLLGFYNLRPSVHSRQQSRSELLTLGEWVNESPFTSLTCTSVHGSELVTLAKLEVDSKANRLFTSHDTPILTYLSSPNQLIPLLLSWVIVLFFFYLHITGPELSSGLQDAHSPHPLGSISLLFSSNIIELS